MKHSRKERKVIQSMKYFSGILKCSIPVVFGVTSVITAISSIYLGVWLPEKVKLAGDTVGVTAFTKIMYAHLLHLSTPVPYFIFSLLITLIGAFEGVYNRYQYGENKRLEALLREETQNHGESQRNYFDSLFEALRYMLASEMTGFDDNCRVTIYRLQNNSQVHLKRIFRYSRHHIYQSDGRFLIPISEGLVGMAWKNHGVIDYEYDGSSECQTAEAHMRQYLDRKGGMMPSAALSMPSKCFVIRCVDELETRRRVAVVVYECTEVGVLKSAEIDSLFSKEQTILRRLIKHLGALDGKLNPDTNGLVR